MCVQVTLLAPISLPKQHVSTYYMQRDGIVKSVGRFIRRDRNRGERGWPVRTGIAGSVPTPLNRAGGTFWP
jgi:hypothetical protein